MKISIKIFFVFIIGFGFANAQSARSLNNKGVDLYKDKKFADSETNFKKGLNEEPNNFETNFNLGDAYYKQQRYDEAIKSFQNSLDKTEDSELKAKSYHNIGNSLLESKKIKESVEAYKNSLKLNPNDEETKYNLSYALSLLKKQNQQQKNNQDKNDKNKNKNQDKSDKNEDHNKNKNDQNKDKDQQNKNKPDQNQTAKNDNLKQPEKDKISKAEAERILEALKNNEKDLQKKLRKQTGKAVKTDKDW